jgi:hypothetical protein
MHKCLPAGMMFVLVVFEASKHNGGFTTMGVFHQVLEKDWRPEFPEQTPELYKEVVSQCWATERENRPSFKDVRGSLTDMLNQVLAT